MSDLALIFEKGWDGMKKDLARAVELYARAIDEGKSTHAMWSPACVLLTGRDGADKDIARALDLFNRAVDGGNIYGMFALGSVHAEGTSGIEKGVGRAAYLWSRAIDEDGHADAMVNLAFCLKRGGRGREGPWSSGGTVFKSNRGGKQHERHAMSCKRAVRRRGRR